MNFVAKMRFIIYNDDVIYDGMVIKMWIAIGILAFLAFLITILLLLPVSVIINNDKDGELQFKIKVLFITFGGKSKKKGSFSDTIKSISKIGNPKKTDDKSDDEPQKLWETVKHTCKLLKDVFKELVRILKYCTVKKFFLGIVCAEETAADTAISYGRCCAVVYPLSSFVRTIMRVHKKSQQIDVSCDFTSGKSRFNYSFIISVKLCHVLAALLRIAIKLARRNASSQDPKKDSTEKKSA